MVDCGMGVEVVVCCRRVMGNVVVRDGGCGKGGGPS